MMEYHSNMKKSQLDWVISQLKTNGKISRNEALRNYISRLGAIIWSLNKSGWEIEGRNERTQNGYGKGLDYFYYLKKQQ